MGNVLGYWYFNYLAVAYTQLIGCVGVVEGLKAFWGAPGAEGEASRPESLPCLREALRHLEHLNLNLSISGDR